MDPITTAYITLVSSTGFPIVVDKFVGVRVGSKDQNKSFVNNSNRDIFTEVNISTFSFPKVVHWKKKKRKLKKINQNQLIK